MHKFGSTIVRRNLVEAIKLAHLTRSFGVVRAVEDLNFTVAAGEIFGLVGPDGAGKTTTMRLLHLSTHV